MADKCIDKDDIKLLHHEAVNDFTHRIQIIHKKSIYPKPILTVLDYIYDNLHTKIKLDILAEKSHLVHRIFQGYSITKQA